MEFTTAEHAAMSRALELAATPGVPLGPNPRVGCVLLADDGRTIAEGYHRGAGTAHAERDALDRAGEAARGATAVVTLEPCHHTGRTCPCSEALVAAGGAARLREAGIDVAEGLGLEEARALNRVWTCLLYTSDAADE